jgi:hypothetical protein
MRYVCNEGRSGKVQLDQQVPGPGWLLAGPTCRYTANKLILNKPFSRSFFLCWQPLRPAVQVVLAHVPAHCYIAAVHCFTTKCVTTSLDEAMNTLVEVLWCLVEVL